MAPPRNDTMALCGRISATELWFAGPRHDMLVSSQMLHMTRLVLTEAPDPELDPSDAARVESYALCGFPDQLLRWYPRSDTRTFSGSCRPPGSAGIPLYSVFTALA